MKTNNPLMICNLFQVDILDTAGDDEVNTFNTLTYRLQGGPIKFSIFFYKLKKMHEIMLKYLYYYQDEDIPFIFKSCPLPPGGS